MQTENKVLAFRAIKDLVKDLRVIFGNSKPLLFYDRIAQHMTESETEQGVIKCIDGFKEFFRAYAKYLDSNEDLMKNLPRNTNINYGNGEKIFITIQMFLYKANEETRTAIRLHLLTISAILDTDGTSLKNLEEESAKNDVGSNDFLNMLGLDKNSNEYKFFDSTMMDIKATLDAQSTADPMSSVMALLPMMPQLMNGLKEKAESGEIDVTKLMNASTIFNSIKTPEGMPNFSDMSNVFAQAAAMGQQDNDLDVIDGGAVVEEVFEEAQSQVHITPTSVDVSLESKAEIHMNNAYDHVD